MRWRRVVVSAWVVATSAAVACSSFEPADDVSSRADGSTDSPTTDASADAAVSDADGSPDVPPGGWTPCAARSADPLKYCEDFDKNLNERLDLDWTTVTSGGGSIEPSPTPLSLPRALLSELPVSGGGQSAWGYLSRPAGVAIDSKTRLSLSFGFRWNKEPFDPSTLTDATFVSVVALAFDDTLPGCPTTPPSALERSLALLFYPPNKLQLAAKGFKEECSASGDFKAAATNLLIGDFSDFKRIRLLIKKVDCAGAQGFSATVEREGVIAVCMPLGIDPFTHASKQLAIRLGLSGGGPSPRFLTQASYDNLTFDVD